MKNGVAEDERSTKISSVLLDNKSAIPISHQSPLPLQTSLGDPGESGVWEGMKNKRNMDLQKAKKISKFPNLT